MATEIETPRSADPSPLDYYLWGWMKTEVYEINVDMREESLARIFDAASHITKHEDQLRLTTHKFAHELQSSLKLTVRISCFLL